MPYPAINDNEVNLLKKIAENTADIAAGGGGGGSVSSVFGRSGAVTAQNGDYTKAQVGLGNVDNTSDANKPVSTAQSAAIAAAQAASQPLDSDLTAIAALTTTAFGRAFLTLADATATQAALTTIIPDSGGWLVGEAWTYVSATSFSVASDVTAKYAKGDKIKLTQTSVKYFYITNVSAFGAGITTITVNGGSDYTLANAAITSPFYSKTATPNGFPDWFNWTPTLTGYSSDPTSVVNRFRISGREVQVAIRQAVNGTSNATTMSFSLPVTAATITNMVWKGMAGLVDNGAQLQTTGIISVASAATTANVFRDETATAFTASAGKRLGVGFISYEF